MLKSAWPLVGHSTNPLAAFKLLLIGREVLYGAVYGISSRPSWYISVALASARVTPSLLATPYIRDWPILSHLSHLTNRPACSNRGCHFYFAHQNRFALDQKRG